MSNLAVKTENLSPELSDYSKAIVLAQGSQLIGDMNTLQISSELVASIQEALYILQHKNKSDEDLGAIALQVGNKLKDGRTTKKQFAIFKSLRIDEIKIAIRRGAFGDYKDEENSNEVLHVSARNIISWIKSYEQTRREAIGEQIKYQEKMKTEVEQAEGLEKQKQWMLQLHQKIEHELSLYRVDKFSKMAWLYFRSLEKIKLVTFTKKRKLEIFKEAVKDVENEIKSKKRSILQVGKESIEKQAVNVARVKALHAWFKMMESQKENIIDLTKQKAHEYIENNFTANS